MKPYLNRWAIKFPQQIRSQIKNWSDLKILEIAVMENLSHCFHEKSWKFTKKTGKKGFGFVTMASRESPGARGALGRGLGPAGLRLASSTSRRGRRPSSGTRTRSFLESSICSIPCGRVGKHDAASRQSYLYDGGNMQPELESQRHQNVLAVVSRHVDLLQWAWDSPCLLYTSPSPRD